MTERTLNNTNPEQAVASGWTIDAGTGDEWECVAKAHLVDPPMMKSTKRIKVPNGWLYQVSTEGPKGYAEAVCFVPEPTLDDLQQSMEIAKAVGEKYQEGIDGLL